MKPVAFESGALPAHEARTRLRDRLQPGQTVYLTKRHETRRGQFVEIGDCGPCSTTLARGRQWSGDRSL